MKWSEVIEDRQLGNLPFKIELNEWGNIVMSPASNRHGFIQTAIALLLSQLKTSGAVLTECSVQTDKGVKVADVVWGSDDFFVGNQFTTPYETAPEVCIEIVSPSNSSEEMREKKALYLAKGAKEVWVCSETGALSFFNLTGEVKQSELFPRFPGELKLRLFPHAPVESNH